MKHILITCFLICCILFLRAQNQDKEIKDADGNIYHSITIGNQTWLKENLCTTSYRNGDRISTTVPITLDISVEKVAKYQWAYNGDDSNAAIYGRLYTWNVVVDKRNICPEGWHIPSDREWNELISYLGGDIVAGGKLREAGTANWAEPNKGATNESGFTALPGGGRLLDGSFNDIKKYGAWWTSNSTSFGANYKYIVYDELYVFKSYVYQSKNFGFSVRCIKD